MTVCEKVCVGTRTFLGTGEYVCEKVEVGTHVQVCMWEGVCLNERVLACVCLWLNGSVSTVFLKEEQIVLIMCCWVTNDEMWWLQTAILDLSPSFCGSEIRA